MTETARSKKKCGPPNGFRVGLTKKGLLTISVKEGPLQKARTAASRFQEFPFFEPGGPRHQRDITRLVGKSNAARLQWSFDSQRVKSAIVCHC